jgi:hypothetical protein
MSKKEKLAKAVVLDNEIKTATVEQLVKMPFEYKEHLAYSATKSKDPELKDEMAVLNGLEVLREKYGLSDLAFILGKFWNDRDTWSRCKELALNEASKRGMEFTDFVQNVLRAEVDKLDELQSGLSRLKYCFNYMKPRAGSEKDVTTTIKLPGGATRIISLRKLNELKENYQSHQDKEIFIAQIIENSTENQTLELEL